MPPAAYAAIETDLPGGSLRQAGRHAGRRILAPHPDLRSNSFPRGIFLVTASAGRYPESTRCGAMLPRDPRAIVCEDSHHA
jgi:hypothetical protein